MGRVNKNVTERHLEAAGYFLSGPLHGDWVGACQKAGFTRVPDINFKTCQAAIEEAQRNRLVEVSEDTELDELLARDDLDWAEMAMFARRKMAQISAGYLQPTPGQVAALKEIIGRHEGRIGSQRQEERPQGVVVLPALVDQDRVPYVQEFSNELGEDTGERLGRATPPVRSPDLEISQARRELAEARLEEMRLSSPEMAELSEGASPGPRPRRGKLSDLSFDEGEPEDELGELDE